MTRLNGFRLNRRAQRPTPFLFSFTHQLPPSRHRNTHTHSQWPPSTRLSTPRALLLPSAPTVSMKTRKNQERIEMATKPMALRSSFLSLTRRGTRTRPFMILVPTLLFARFSYILLFPTSRSFIIFVHPLYSPGYCCQRLRLLLWLDRHQPPDRRCPRGCRGPDCKLNARKEKERKHNAVPSPSSSMSSLPPLSTTRSGRTKT